MVATEELVAFQDQAPATEIFRAAAGARLQVMVVAETAQMVASASGHGKGEHYESSNN